VDKSLYSGIIYAKSVDNSDTVTNPAELDKLLFAGIIYAKRVDNSATVTKFRSYKYNTNFRFLLILRGAAAILFTRYNHTIKNLFCTILSNIMDMPVAYLQKNTKPYWAGCTTLLKSTDVRCIMRPILAGKPQVFESNF
jgi:hypothetical protein